MSEIFEFYKPKLMKRAFIITKAGREVGQLAFNGFLRPRAHATLNGQQWDIGENGFLATRVVVKQETKLVAEYAQSVFGRVGTVSVEGQVYSFGKKGRGRASYYVWTDNDGQELVTYAHRGPWKKPGTIMAIPSIMKSPHHQMLIPLGLFLGINKDTDDASVTAA